MGDMLATLPRVAPPACGSSLPPQELAAGGQINVGFSRGNQDDPRCNGTLRKQTSPRSNRLGAALALTAGQGKARSQAADMTITQQNALDLFTTLLKDSWLLSLQ